MFITCRSSNSDTGQLVLAVPNGIFPDLRVYSGKEIFIMLGLSKYKASVALEPAQREHCELLLPEDHPLKLQESHHFTAHFHEKEQTLYLGPIIAVLTDTDSSGSPSLGQLEKYYDELYQFTKKQGGLFFLTCTSLLSRQRGCLWDEQKGEWIEGSVPLPDVLYNRIHSRRSDKSETVQNLIAQLEEQSVYVFNSSYLTKEYVHELLTGEKHLEEYLPHTETFTLSSLNRMLENYSDLFIKHIAGSQGKKLLRLSYLDHEYCLFQNMRGVSVLKSFTSFEETAEELVKLKVSSHFIIQETIPLLGSEDRALDFRFLCHLSDCREWKLVSSVARIAGEGQFVSNVAQGGDLAKPLNVLCEFFSRHEAVRIYRMMEELAVSVCTLLADKCPLTLGELGIDLGVDETGKPWLIEVNSKPSKQTYFDNSVIRPSVKTLYHLSKSIWEERRVYNDPIGNHDAGT
ncbi:MAG: YheC/YheD family protein [Bacillota bacterium]